MELQQPSAPLWQRITAPPPASQEDLRPLFALAEEAVQDSRFLVTHWKAAGDPGKKLYETALECQGTLKGLQSLRGGPKPAGKPIPGVQTPIRRILERSYYRAVKLHLEFTARSGERDQGLVFAWLAHRQQMACGWIARMLGQLG